MAKHFAAIALVFAALILSGPGGRASAQPADPARSHADLAVMRDCLECPELVVIPGGSFTMGAVVDPASHVWQRDDEGPPVRVTITRFLIGRMEISNADVGHCIADGACPLFSEYGDDVNFMHPALRYQIGSPRPVLPDWPMIQEYLAWLSNTSGYEYRLPSEAEWEYAARARTATTYFWGDDPHQACPYANARDSAFARSIRFNSAEHRYQFIDCDDGQISYTRVGQYRPNPFGLFDMLGNVSEIVADCYHPSHENTPPDGSPYISSQCGQRVQKGGRSDNGSGCGLGGYAWDITPTARDRANTAASPMMQPTPEQRPHRSIMCSGFRVARSIR